MILVMIALLIVCILILLWDVLKRIITVSSPLVLSINVKANILQHHFKHFGSNDTFRKVKWLNCMYFQLTLQREWLKANVAYRRSLKEIFSFKSDSKWRLLGYGHVSETAPHESDPIRRQERHKTVCTSFILA